MSVVNVFVSSKRAVMLTDSSIYQADGIPIAFERKAFPVDSWNGVIAGRGDIWGTAIARELAEEFASFDEFIARSGPVIEQLHKLAVANSKNAGQNIIEVHAIGWSERNDRAEAYYLMSASPKAADGPAYVWRDHAAQDGCFITEISSREEWRLHRQGAEPHVDFTSETFNPMRHGIPLVEAQRRKAAEAIYGAAAAGKFVVGGDIWLTIVDRDGTRQDVMHGWPDDVYEPIQPAPFDESTLPEIAPSGWPEDWPFAMFQAGLQCGAIHAETLKTDMPKLQAMVAANPSILDAKPVGRMTRKERRAADAEAKKARRHAA